MSDTSPRLELPYLLPGQAQKHVTHNEALKRLDGLVQLVAETLDAQTPPADPAPGAVFGLGAAPTGAWAGQAGALAIWDGVAWEFIGPLAGWRAWDRAQGLLAVHDGAGWGPLPVVAQNLDGLGVGTASDATNRLAVQAEASLFSHAGAGHRVKINKAGLGDTASVLFQSGWTGHAEIGLSGDTGLSVKLSEDGDAWVQALRLTPGAATLDVPLGGTAVQADAMDTTPGRLMLAQHGVLRSAILGPVLQSGGMPTGAVIERGSNANGEYVKWADGTQICNASLNPDWATAGNKVYAFPATFSETPRGGVGGMRSGSSNAIANFGSIKASGSGTFSTWFVNLDGSGPGGSAGEVLLTAVFFGKWF